VSKARACKLMRVFPFRIKSYDGYTEKVFKIPQSDKECAEDGAAD